VPKRASKFICLVSQIFVSSHCCCRRQIYRYSFLYADKCLALCVSVIFLRMIHGGEFVLRSQQVSNAIICPQCRGTIIVFCEKTLL
jgi:hypothetical protein